MKKLLTLFLTLVMVQIVQAQNFPADMPELLLGKTVTFRHKDTESQKYGYRGIYADSAMREIYKKAGTSTPYDALAGKTFIVKNVEKVSSGDFERYRISIENQEQGVIYYKYVVSVINPDYPFEVKGGLSYPEGFFCRELKQEKITADGQTAAPPADGLRFIKTPEANGYSIALAINVAAKDVALGDGAVIKLENGKTISRPKQPVAGNTNGSGGMVYTTFFELTKEDVAVLREHKIVEVQLYRHNHEIENGYTLREYLKCLDK